MRRLVAQHIMVGSLVHDDDRPRAARLESDTSTL